MNEIVAGKKVRLKDNPERIGLVGAETEGSGRRFRVLVCFFDGTEDFFLPSALEPIEGINTSPFMHFKNGRYSLAKHLRTTVTYHRLSGKLANLIYSLNTTNTDFYPHQFKPVLQILESPSNGILIADEVGLGKTIEAGLIWTELRARIGARRLLVICPAVLRYKWREELLNRFGVNADIVNASELLKQLELAHEKPTHNFALIASMQGIRPPKTYDDLENKSGAASLARFLENTEQKHPALIDMLVIDEAHYLRNQYTKTHSLGKLVRPHADYVALLSATPIQLAELDLYSLLNLLDEAAFPTQYVFEQYMKLYRLIVQAKNNVASGSATQQQLIDDLVSINRSYPSSLLDDLIANPPSDIELKDLGTRLEISERLDKVHPLSKLITRTLKRDVQENRVLRYPVSFKAELSSVEEAFYNLVTGSIREFCDKNELPPGFILATPQRQMASSIPAAYKAWRDKSSEINEELVAEIDDSNLKDIKPLGRLVSYLVEVTDSIGNYQELKSNDSKYQKLLESLKKYSNEYPDNKIVLFSFFRTTLAYLKERLDEDGFSSIVLQGGSDKEKTIKAFREQSGPTILLSSEVGSEGVDLQFSSLIINYDLPWNPMRIEQRIGRIDRLGQKADKILIYNFMYKNTIDERIYDRLLMRLDVFTQALGNIESIMGIEIDKMTRDLYSHHLTREEEEQRIEQTRFAIENTNKQQSNLEDEAPNLVAHGDFITNKVNAANELGRFIQSDDLYAYAVDYLVENYPGTIFTPINQEGNVFNVSLSTDLQVQLNDFIRANELYGSTNLLSDRSQPIQFDNQLKKPSDKIERVSQDHALIRFVTYKMDSSNSFNKNSVSAVKIKLSDTSKIKKGIYIFYIARWSFTGAQTTERLVYTAINTESHYVLTDDEAELLVNTAALKGEDWAAAKNLMDGELAAELYDECRHIIDEKYNKYKNIMKAENQDRITLMVKLLDDKLQQDVKKFEERVHRYEMSGEDNKLRLIPAMKGQIKKTKKLYELRKAEFSYKQRMEMDNKPVTAGVIIAE